MANRKNTKLQLVPAILLVTVLSIQPAHAYVDPGSGSVLVTTILGVIAAVAYWFRRSFYNIRGWFRARDKDSGGGNNCT